MDRSEESNDEAALLPDSPELILQARQGDVTAWEVLVRQHQEPIFRLAYLFLGDSAEAEDTAQETFLRAYQALHRFTCHARSAPGCSASPRTSPATASAHQAAS